MNGDYSKMRHYRRGDRVEIEMRGEGWISGTITDVLMSLAGVLVLLKLDDGRDAMCASEKCIRMLKSDGA